MNESEIKLSTKSEYKKKIKSLLMKAAFCEHLKEKDQKSKLNQCTYETFKIQPYLTKYGFTVQTWNLAQTLHGQDY